MDTGRRNWVLLIIGIFLFAGIVIATTVITDRGITFDQGILIDVQEINLTGDPLIISDSTNNKVIAIFNDGVNEIEQIALKQSGALFGGTATSFFGDVNNFDNTNAFSRFKEVNLNAGSNASAGFIGINNINHSLSFGIGSSNFEFMNLSLNNIGAIRLRSPADMFFINDFISGWFWVSDQNDTTGFTDPRAVMDLDANGNLNILGNFTGNQLYAEGSFFQPITRQAVTPSGLFVPTSINFEESKTNGFAHPDNANFTALVPGRYKTFYSVSYLDGASQTHVFAIGLNGVFQENTATASSTSNANHVATPTGGGFVDLEIGDNLTVVTMDINNPVNTIDVGATNFNVVRIGD